MSSSRDRLAKALIDDAHAALVGEQVAEVERLQSDVDAARRRLLDVEQRARQWHRRGRLDHEIALRALALAQASDLFESAAVPAGVHLRALSEYLAQHHPPHLLDGSEPAVDRAADDRSASEREALRRLHSSRGPSGLPKDCRRRSRRRWRRLD